MWIERRPKEGDTVKVTWSNWYAKAIGQKSTVGVVLPGGQDRFVIDVGDKHIWILPDSQIEVFER